MVALFGRRPELYAMTNLLEPAINANDGDLAADATFFGFPTLGIQSDDVVNYVFPKASRNDREQRAKIIGEWLQTEDTLPRLVTTVTDEVVPHFHNQPGIPVIEIEHQDIDVHRCASTTRPSACLLRRGRGR